MNPLFGWEVCAVQQDTFYSHQDNEHVNFSKKSGLCLKGRSSETGKSQLFFTIGSKLGPLDPKHTKFIFLLLAEGLFYAQPKRTHFLQKKISQRLRLTLKEQRNQTVF